MSTLLYPIAPKLRFRVGVTGHRSPPKLPKESEAPTNATVSRILETVAASVSNAEADLKMLLPESDGRSPPPLALSEGATSFVIVSSIAEGADRLVADAGLAAAFGLEVVLPFARSEYAKDFDTAASKAQYERLLDRAGVVFELDGAGGDRPRAYEAAGLVMLANCDLLIAIWNGEEAAGVGGTAHIVSRAIADGIPVAWIRPENPEVFKISWPLHGQIPPANALPTENFRDCGEQELGEAITEIVAPPRQREARNALKRYLSEQGRFRHYHQVYAFLLHAYGIRRLRLGDVRLPAIDEISSEWQPFLKALPADTTQRPAIEKILLPAFAAADRIAVYYSHAYRSSYVFNFIFAATAVAVALGGVFTHDEIVKSILVAVEVVIICAILFSWRRGHGGEWHRRWLDYRRLAECLRHLRIFAPLGAEGPVERTRRGFDTDEEDWVNWYTWALRRLLPLPNCIVDDKYLEWICDAVRNGELKGQIKYHRSNAKRMHKLDHRIHFTGLVMFSVTAALCFAFAPLAWSGLLHRLNEPNKIFLLSLLTFITALLPTLSAALGGIHAQGDFKTVAEQSARTLQRLRAIGKVLKFDPLTFARLSDRVAKASEIMMSDLLEWQTVFRTRPLSPPV
jgi:hypothetical protein